MDLGTSAVTKTPILEDPSNVSGNSNTKDQQQHEQRQHRRAVDTPMKEACYAWERSLRPGQYYSEKWGNRPMRHRTQAVQGRPGARAWPRGPDGGAWGPQHLSPIPSERSYAPLVPSPTTSPGRRSRVTRDEAFSSAIDAEAVADTVAAEAILLGSDRDALRPFDPIPLEEEALPPPPPAAPLEAPWRPPPPGFDTRTLRRQASDLRAEGAEALKDQETVRRSSERLAEILAMTFENGCENTAASRTRLCQLHSAFRRLKKERLSHEEAVRAAVAWEESAEGLRDKLQSSLERLRRAQSAKAGAQRAFEAAVESNRTTEVEVIRLEKALAEARRKDAVAAQMEREARQEDLADAFCRRDRSKPFVFSIDDNDDAQRQTHVRISDGGSRDGTIAHDNNLVCMINPSQGLANAITKPSTQDVESPSASVISPLLAPILSWGFQLLVEACRRSRGLRMISEARSARAELENRMLLREAIAGWAVAAALARQERSARRRRTEESARLCLARWRLFSALEKRFRQERKRRICLRVMEALRRAVDAGRRRHALDRRREILVVRRCLRAWRVLRARSTLTPKEYSQRRRAADHHRLLSLFETWHMSSLASAAASRAAIRGFQRQRATVTLANTFWAWAYSSRARAWRRRRCLRLGLAALIETAGLSRCRVRPLRYGLPAGCEVVSRGVVCGSCVASHSGGEAFFAGCETAAGERGNCGGPWGGARAALVAWCEAARARRRAREGVTLAVDAFQKWCLARAVREWRKRTSVSALRRRKRRRRVLRTAFVALRQACTTSRARRAAGQALSSILHRRYVAVIRQAMGRLRAVPTVGGDAAARAAAIGLRGRAARRRREREALGAAWRWWVGGWLRRRAEQIRTEELEARRENQRARGLEDQLRKLREASAVLSQEASAVEKELKNAELLVLEQEEALAVSTTSLIEATAAVADLKSHLGDATGNGDGRAKGRGIYSGGGRDRSRLPAGGKGKQVKGIRGGGLGTAASDEDRRLRARRLAQQRAAARVLQVAEARRREAEEKAAAREAAAARARQKLLKQEEANKAAIEGARSVAQRYRDFLEQEQRRIEDAESEKSRAHLESARLLARADGLERRAEEEVTQGARGASAAESERAALSLEVSTAEARARELMLMLDERQQEADALRRALAAKECERQEKTFDTTVDSRRASGEAARRRPAKKTTQTRKKTGGNPAVESANGVVGRESRPSRERLKVSGEFSVLEAKPSLTLLEGLGGTASRGREGHGRISRALSGAETPGPTTDFYNDLSQSISVLQEKVSARML